MKTTRTYIILASLLAGASIAAAQQPPGGAPAPAAAPDQAAESTTNGVAPPAVAANPAEQAVELATNAAAAPLASANGTNGIFLNFHQAPLETVLNYLSAAAGFVIDLQGGSVSGRVDVWSLSKEPLTKDEAVEVLTSALAKSGYNVIRKGRILTIISQDPRNSGIPVKTLPANINDIPANSEVATYIIPVRYANANQLMANLQQLLPTGATLSANESANTLLLTDTQSDVRRMVQIVTALDTSIASVSSIRVIPLTYADAKDLATLITQLFTPQGTQTGGGGGGGRANLFATMLAGVGRGGGRGGGGGGGATGSPGEGAAATRVVAVGDDRSNSLIISAPADLLATISDMVEKIDQPVTDVTELRVFHLTNADPTELANQLSQLFPNDSNSTQNTPGGFFFGRGGFRGGAAAANTATTSTRARKMGQVMAVADPRTKSLIVTASKTMMPDIANMIDELDQSKGQKEIVGVYDLHDADPQDVQQILSDLFNRSTRMQSSSSSTRNMLGTGNPLTQRETQTQPTLNTGTSSGGVGGMGGAGGLGTGGR